MYELSNSTEYGELAREENNIVPTTMANTDSNMLSGVTITEIGISNDNPSMIREPTSAKIMEEMNFEFERRKSLLDGLVKNNITDYTNITRISYFPTLGTSVIRSSLLAGTFLTGFFSFFLVGENKGIKTSNITH